MRARTSSLASSKAAAVDSGLRKSRLIAGLYQGDAKVGVRNAKEQAPAQSKELSSGWVEDFVMARIVRLMYGGSGRAATTTTLSTAGTAIALMLAMCMGARADTTQLNRDNATTAGRAVEVTKGDPMGEAGKLNWYKGDVHYHEVKQVPVADTIPMLKKLGYDFVILEYKDMEPPEVVPPAGSLTRPDFLVIHGSEQAFRSRAEKWAHLSIAPNHIPFPDTETDNWHIPEGFDKIHERIPNALIRINHPADKRWTMDDLREAVARGARIFELNPCDGEGVDFAVRLWDQALAERMLLYAELSTDIHHISAMGRCGWAMVRAEKLEQRAILEAMRAGELVAVQEGCEARVADVKRGNGKPGSTYEIAVSGAAIVRFIGQGGKELARVQPQDGAASYAIRGDEIYVRAEVEDPAGRKVYAQPVMVGDAH